MTTPLDIPGDGRVSTGRLLLDAVRARRETPPALAARRRARLVRLVEFARARSAYYRQACSALPKEGFGLEDLPPVTKTALMENFDAWTTDPEATRAAAERFVGDPSTLGRLFLGRYVAFATSGTTGRPAVFLHDRHALSVYAALMSVRRLPPLLASGRLLPFLANRARTATIITTGGHFTSSVVEALVRARHPVLSAFNRTFSLLEPLPALVRALNDFRPAIIGSYPTALSVLAGEQDAGRLRIRPALALSGAERLTAAAAGKIAASFRCPLRDTYAASEFMGIAFDCDCRRLHVNADWVILEPVDADGRPVSPGEPSHSTLLTNLANRIQPLIRYDLGDSITVFPDRCPCGDPLPSIRVEGRRDEILLLESGDGSRRPLLPLVLATVIEDAPGVAAYQLVQAGPRRLVLRLDEVPGSDRSTVCAEVARRLREYLSRQGLESVDVEPSGERPRRHPAGGKLLQFFSERDSR